MMSTTSHIGRFGALLVLGIAAAELLIMVSPFAGLFFTSLRYESLLGVLSQSRLTAWLDGFFLNHSVVTTSPVLEGHRWVGRYLFALGIWGFLISAFQVYGNKIFRRGIARGLLYRFVRHPQYFCLAVAGWGLLTIWPRFLLLGVWVTMLFLYAGLARFEEMRMTSRFGDAYVQYKSSKGAFLPGSPVHKLFEATFGKLRPRFLGWIAAYVVSLVLAFSSGFALLAMTRASSAIAFKRDHQMAVISAWPKPDHWMHEVVDIALKDERVGNRLDEVRLGSPLIVTILPPQYTMLGMYYKRGTTSHLDMRGLTFHRLCRIALKYLVPIKGLFWTTSIGEDPDKHQGAVKIVFSRVEKPYKTTISLEESLDAGVRMIPLVVATVLPWTKKTFGVIIPPPQNIWGPQVVMPFL
jgi:protein-S-isoprenylcysteine O-methyltransferase Ste14